MLFTGEDVRGGQEVFLRNGVMQFGSIFGHGAYLGPDFTADYLHRAAIAVEAAYGGEGTDASRRTIEDFRTNTYDPATNTVVYTDAQAAAYQRTGGALPRPSSPTRSATPDCDRPRSTIPKTPAC